MDKKGGLLLLVLCILASVCQGHSDRLIIVPNPQQMQHGQGAVVVKDCISINSATNDLSFVEDLKEMYKGQFFKNSNDLGFNSNCSVSISLEIENPEIMMPSGFEPEIQKYSLYISEQGQISISSNYKVGVLRAMDTLSQIIDIDEGEMVLPFLPLSINDQPRYGYIGLSLDLSRNFYPVDVLKKIIDGCRMTKLNSLHLHLTDDDSIPIQLSSFPGMTDFTALTKEEVYTIDDIKEIVDYAYNNGIKVVPEFDVPGHTRAVGLFPALEHLLTCMDYNRPWEMPDGGYIEGGPGRGVLDPSKPETYEFIQTVLKEFKEIFSKSDFYHMGGDEVDTQHCWDENPEIKKWMDSQGLKDGSEVFHHFQDKVGEIAQNEGMRTAHWMYSENWDLKWDKDSILQYWGTTEHVQKFKEVYPDHQHILSFQDKFYFDCGLGNRYGVDLCNPYQTWSRIRMVEPTEWYDEGDNTLLGGEGCMWSELNTVHNVFDKIWPRLAVVSSIFWSPKMSTPYNWGNIVEDLVKFRDSLRDNGIPANQVSSRYVEAHAQEVFKKFNQEEISLIHELLS